MFGQLDIFRMAAAMAQNAAARQAVTTENVANANTPGYRARDVPPFASTYQQSASAFVLRTTRPQHITEAPDSASMPAVIDRSAPLSPDGNSVSLEREMVRAVETRNQYDTALAIYKSSLNILRISLGRR